MISAAATSSTTITSTVIPSFFIFHLRSLSKVAASPFPLSQAPFLT
jgi:hypothetical protein